MTAYESTELLDRMKALAGHGLVPAPELFAAYFRSDALLTALSEAGRIVVENAQQSQGRKIALGVFGSLGRGEYVAGASDLDPILIVEGDCDAMQANQLRSMILTPLAEMNPWLAFDHREAVLTRRWEEIAQPNLCYPVVSHEDLVRSREPSVAIRRQQILLEAKPLGGADYFDSIYRELADCFTNSQRIDIDSLLQEAQTFFARFDDKRFLYKTAHKFIKTRFLRDVFAFGTTLSLLVECFESDHSGHAEHILSVSTLTKLLRGVTLVEKLETACNQNPPLKDAQTQDMIDTVRRYGMHEDDLLVQRSALQTIPARILSALLLGLIVRFKDGWEQVYAPRSKIALAKLDPGYNFDGQFPQDIADPTTRMVVDRIVRQRASYLRYIALTARILRDVYPFDVIWTVGTAVQNPRQCMDPFVAFVQGPV